MFACKAKDVARMSWVWRYGVLAMLLGLMGYVEMSRSPRTNEDSPPGKNETTEWNETTRAVSHGGPEALGLEHLKEAFEEQGYYLERLFLQYGENGTLSYGGLQQLLGSLGLGGVSVLQISHHGLKPAPPTPQHAPPSGQHPNSPPSPLPHMDRQEGAASVDTTETHHRQTNGRAGAGHGKQPLAPHPPPGKTQPSPGMDHPIQTHFHGNVRTECPSRGSTALLRSLKSRAAFTDQHQRLNCHLIKKR
ncbi:hypothetical protein JZ751_009305 [Albula glossodonta]|uniref:Uncharacterized protein n=1 Tax=Albula glossodonta TaxID=121402 RepID=A0A8T2N0F8_9TELE|nr:hypothetical protein JZ751_009305 [Albula glossodonta]